MFRFLTIFLTVYCSLSQAWSTSHISAGIGEPERARIFRIGVTDDWQWIMLSKNRAWHLQGYWDYSLAYWYTQKHLPNAPQQLWALAAAPVLRMQVHAPIHNLSPFLEASIGAVLSSRSHLGHRIMGSVLNFQDIVGGGLVFGQQQQYELSCRYLHYSNAHIFPPNNGIDAKMLLTFAYRFNNNINF